MIQESFLFVAEKEDAANKKLRKEQIERHVASWGYCWGWSGPTVGGRGEVNQCISELMPDQDEIFDGNPHFCQDKNQWPREKLYCYMEEVRFIRQIDEYTWEAEIDMQHDGKPWYKNGIRLKMDILDIWVPTRQLRREQNEQRKHVDGRVC